MDIEFNNILDGFDVDLKEYKKTIIYSHLVLILLFAILTVILDWNKITSVVCIAITLNLVMRLKDSDSLYFERVIDTLVSYNCGKSRIKNIMKFRLNPRMYKNFLRFYKCKENLDNEAKRREQEHNELGQECDEEGQGLS